MRSMKRLGLMGVLTVAALASPAGAAKDLCVTDSLGGAIKFSKVSSLKKPGKIVELHGFLVTLPPVVTTRGSGGGDGRGLEPYAAPVVGTAVTQPDGGVLVGIFVLGSSAIGSSTGSASLETDQELNGSGANDLDGDFQQGDAYSWTAADCDTLPFP